MTEEEYYSSEPAPTPYYPDYTSSEPEIIEEQPNTTAEGAPYVAEFVNTTAATLVLEHLYAGEWLEFRIPPRESRPIGSDRYPMRVRLCECYYSDAAAAVPEWPVKASEAGKREPTKRFDFYTDKTGRIDLRSGRR